MELGIGVNVFNKPIKKKREPSKEESCSSGRKKIHICTNFSKRVKYMDRRRPNALWDEIRSSDNPERYKEELRRQRQAELVPIIHRKTASRLGVAETFGLFPCHERYEEVEITLVIPEKLPSSMTRQNGLKLSNVSIHPCVIGCCGEPVNGTLEVKVGGFQYSSHGSPFLMDVIMHINVSHAFFQYGDEKTAPFLHLHLHKPIKVGTEMTNDIQFRMVQQTFEGRKKRLSHDDSDKLCVEKEQQESVDNNNKVLRTFVDEVNYFWISMVSKTYKERKRCFEKEQKSTDNIDKVYHYIRERLHTLYFDKVEENCGFHGKIPLKEQLDLSSVFVVTLFCLVQLENTPFLVVKLNEIEIVNLTRVGSGLETTFTMTIVFKDFKCDVVQINSIPLTELNLVKQSLHIGDVKYYENQLNPDWGFILKEITDKPTTFFKTGGWEFLKPSNSVESDCCCCNSGDDNSDGDSDDVLE